MANNESPLFRDIFISSTAVIHDINEDSLHYVDFTDTDVQTDDEDIKFPFDIFSLNYIKEDGITETISVDQFLSNSSFDLPQSTTIPSSSSSSVYTNLQQYIVPSCSPSIDSKYHLCPSLSFINPPEPIYHVRYLSEITNSPLDGNIVNTKKKTKKNVSGRYLKGTHGRHVTIALPSILLDHSNLFIRVTRLTVPYQDISFIHPYPLLYSPPKKKTHSDVIIKDPSIYFKLNKEDICSHSKRFPNIILTRRKQCSLKQINYLHLFDNSEIMHPFLGNNAKNKIATYQLKKSQLDFRLVFQCNQTGEFSDTNISCRSNELLEEEGTECKKLLVSPSLEFSNLI